MEKRQELYRGKAKTWQGLNTKWAYPGCTYGQKIIDAVMADPLNNVEAVGNATLMLCSVDPKFVMGTPEAENEVSLSDVDLADKVYAWNWITGSSTDIESFRGATTLAVAVAPDGEGVQPAP